MKNVLQKWVAPSGRKWPAASDRKRLASYGAALALAFLAPAALAQGVVKAEQFTLANGLTVIVKPDRRAPTAVHMLWLRVGSMDEVDGTSGVAHVLEHMMFKGTKKLKPGEFSRQVAALGGRENAFTGRDYTGYFQQIPVGRLEDVMRLEADRFANSQWPDDEFKRELEVVKEERRLRTEDAPRALLYEALSGVVFQASPYRRPIVGWMSDLEAMTAQDARDFFKRWYVPANAAVVVAGDVDPAEVRRLAEKYYGGMPARPVPERKPRTEPAQAGARRLDFKAPAEQAYVALSFKVPQFSSFDAPAGAAGALGGNAAAPVGGTAAAAGSSSSGGSGSSGSGGGGGGSVAPFGGAAASGGTTVPAASNATPGAASASAADDALALTVLAAVLDGYSGARLDRALTQGPDRVADSAGAGNGLWGRGPQLFTLDGVPAAGKTAAQVEAALRAEVVKVARDGVTEAELSRVKTQWIAGEVYKLDSVMNQARELGSAWAQGLPLDANERLIQRLRGVTAEQVKSVATRYFGNDQMSVGTLLPQPVDQNRKPRTPPPGSRH